MSRVGKSPIPIPEGTKVEIGAENQVTATGPLGTLSRGLNPEMRIREDAGTLLVERPSESKQHCAQHGLTRTLLNNMVVGCSTGFVRKLSLVGVGYRAQAQGNKLNLTLGFSHPVVHEVPEGVTVETPSQTEIIVKGADKQQVGQVAAEIRGYRPPEPYKGKGVRYSDERVVIKEAKKK